MSETINISAEENVQNVTVTVNEVAEEVNISVQETVEQINISTSQNVSVIIPQSIENRLLDVEGGLIQFNNTLHTESNPFTVTNGVEFILPIRNDGGIFSQAPTSFQTLIDNSDNGINVLKLFDVIDMKIVMTIKTDLSDRVGEFFLDIGGSIGAFNDFEVKGSKNANQDVKRTVDKWFYQGFTFQDNKGFVKGTFDGDGEIWDIITVFNLKKRGTDI